MSNGKWDKYAESTEEPKGKWDEFSVEETVKKKEDLQKSFQETIPSEGLGTPLKTPSLPPAQKPKESVSEPPSTSTDGYAIAGASVQEALPKSEQLSPVGGLEYKFQVGTPTERIPGAEAFKSDAVDGFYNALDRGWKQGEIADLMALGQIPAKDDVRRVAQIKREQEGLKPSKAYEAFNASKTASDAMSEFVKNPFEISGQLIGESMAALLRHGLTRVGAASAIGAGAGSVIPGVGTAAGASTGFMAGMGVAGYNLEVASSILESLQEAGVDITDPVKLEEGFNDEEKVSNARSFANKRGIPIALFDMFSAGIAGKILGKPAKTMIGKIGQTSLEAGTQSFLAGGGEAAAQLVAEQKINPTAILSEMIGEVGGGAPEIVVGTIIESKKNGQPTKDKIVKSRVDKETFEQMVDISEGAGEVTPQQADELKKEFEDIKKVKDKIPDDFKENEKVVNLVEQKDVLEKQKESVDESFHPEFDRKIKEVKDKIQDEVVVKTEPPKQPSEPATKEEVTPAEPKTEDVPAMKEGLAPEAKVEEIKPEESVAEPTYKQVVAEQKAGKVVSFKYKTLEEIPQVFKDEDLVVRWAEKGGRSYSVELTESQAKYYLSKENPAQKSLPLAEDIKPGERGEEKTDKVVDIASEYGWTATPTEKGGYEFSNRNGKKVGVMNVEKGRNVFYDSTGKKKLGSDPNLERGVNDLISKQFYGSKLTSKEPFVEAQPTEEYVAKEFPYKKSKTPVEKRKKIDEVYEKEQIDFANEMIDTGLFESVGQILDYRPQLGLSTADVIKGIKDIKAGKNTAPARKVIEASKDIMDNGEIPMIIGRGGMMDKRGISLDEWRKATKEDPHPTELTESDIADTEKLTDTTAELVEKEGITKENFDIFVKENDWLFSPEELKQIKTYLDETAEPKTRGDVKVEAVKVEGEGVGEVKAEATAAEPTAGEITPEKEDELRKEVQKGLSEKLKSIGETLKGKPQTDGKKEAGDIINAKIFPFKEIIQSLLGKPLNKIQEKTFGRLADIGKEWAAKQIKSGLQSQNTAKRWLSQFATSWSNGLPRTQKDLSEKMQLKGKVNLSQVKFKEGLKKLHNQVGNSSESLERIHQVLDPDFYDENPSLFGARITENDLTPAEKELYEFLKKTNEYIHDWNFSMGLIDMKTYLDHKGKYIARMYDAFEMPDDVKDFLEQNELPIGGKATKITTDIFKARKEIDEWKKNHVIRDPAYLTLKRMAQTETNAAVLSYIDHIASQKGMVSKDARPGFTQLNGKGYGKLNGAYVPNYIAEDFKGYFFGNQIVDLMYDAAKLYDKTQLRQFLKKFHTVYSPAVQLGNNSSNFVFALLSGIDPITMISKYPDAYKELRDKGSDYEFLVKSGILGSDVITADLRPITKKTEAIMKDTDGIKKGLLDMASKLDKQITDLYSGSDDMAKMAAFKSLKEYGYSNEKAVELVYNGFQNYSSVGKIWDLASKAPLIGNPFIKFQADLQRIVANAVLRRPLSTAMFIAILHQIASIASKSVGETEEEKEIREGRKFIPKIKLPEIIGGDAPLVFQSPVGELNLARFLSPYYSYDVGDLEHPIEQMSKYMPFQAKLVEGGEKGSMDVYLPKQDPLVGPWWSAIVDDMDFREKSIQDPTSTRFRSSGVTAEERTLNAMNYIARSQVPLYSNVTDMVSAWQYGTDFYGRDKNPAQTIMNMFIKVQDYSGGKYKEEVEKQLKNIEFNVTNYEQNLKQIDKTIEKELDVYRKKMEEGKITEEQYSNKEKDLMDSQIKRRAEYIEKIAKEQDELNRITLRYADILN